MIVNELSLNMRVSIIITPDVSIQIYENSSLTHCMAHIMTNFQEKINAILGFISLESQVMLIIKSLTLALYFSLPERTKATPEKMFDTCRVFNSETNVQLSDT